MRFIILVEGHTEKLAIHNFIKRWIDIHLNPNIGVRLRIQEPGVLKTSIEKQVRSFLEADINDEIIGIFGLRDLYGLGKDYEGKRSGPDLLFNTIRSDIEKHINDSRFKMFFAVHEFEAWLLSEPEIFPGNMHKEILKYSSNPEKINFDKPPSVCIKDLYRRKFKRGYMKTTDGNRLFEKLDPNLVYSKCSHFKMIMDEIVKMALDKGVQII